jgi:hypothetical protein
VLWIEGLTLYAIILALLSEWLTSPIHRKNLVHIQPTRELSSNDDMVRKMCNVTNVKVGKIRVFERSNLLRDIGAWWVSKDEILVVCLDAYGTEPYLLLTKALLYRAHKHRMLLYGVGLVSVLIGMAIVYNMSLVHKVLSTWWLLLWFVITALVLYCAMNYLDRRTTHSASALLKAHFKNA